MANLVEKPNNWYKKDSKDVEFTKRKCLPCGKMFDSWGVGNRICKECKTSSAYKDAINTTSIKM